MSIRKIQSFNVGDIIVLKHLLSTSKHYNNENECIGIVHKVEKEYFFDKQSSSYKDKLTIITNSGNIRTASSNFAEYL